MDNKYLNLKIYHKDQKERDQEKGITKVSKFQVYLMAFDIYDQSVLHR